MQKFFLSSVAILLISSAAVAQTSSGGNCSSTKDMKYADFLKCYYKGEPPPLESRPGGGRGTVAGSLNPNAAATNITGWRSPENPPIEGGNGVSSAFNNFLNNFQNFIKKSSGGSGSGGGGSGAGSGGGSNGCPPGSSASSSSGSSNTSTTSANASGNNTTADASGSGSTNSSTQGCPPSSSDPGRPVPDAGFCPVEGDRVALSNASYACGGAIPITGMSKRINNLQDSPIALSIVDDGVYLFNYFRKDNAKQIYALGKQYKLPRFLCRYEDITDENGIIKRVKVKDIDIPPPLAQLYSYNSTTQAIYLKLKTLNANFAFTLEEEFLTKNKTLLIPIRNNMPYVPKDDENNDGDLEECDLTKDYYVDEPRNTAFLSILPFEERVCDQGQYYLADSCERQFIMFNADDPTIVMPENTSVEVYPVEGRNEVMVSTNRNSQMMLKYSSLVRLGTFGKFFFSDGAAIIRIGDPLLTQDDRRLWIGAPTEINSGTSVVQLPKGGWEENAGGVHTQEYPEGSSINVTYGLPFIVTPQGIMQTRSTMEYPTLNTSYIRKPVNPPE